MQIKPLEQFYKEEYDVRFVNCLRQYWRDMCEFCCIGAPKKKNIFLLLEGCSARYENKDGTVCEAHSGDLVYTPVGSEYKMRVYGFENSEASTIGINFDLFDVDGEPFTVSEKPTVFSANEKIKMLCREIERFTYAPTQMPTGYKVLLYEILNELGLAKARLAINNSNFRLIQKGLEYLSLHFEEEISVGELARLCGVSESYFRRLFRLYLGKSPVRYRVEIRIERAKEYLRYGENSVNEIAGILGYIDSAYFIKQFKKETGVTPLAYRAVNKL